MTVNRILMALEVMPPLMRAKGLSAGAQIALVKLYRRLADERDAFCLAERNLVDAWAGAVDGEGKVTFTDASAAESFRREQMALRCAEVEIDGIELQSADALWAVMTPEILINMEGIIEIKEEKHEGVE